MEKPLRPEVEEQTWCEHIPGKLEFFGAGFAPTDEFRIRRRRMITSTTIETAKIAMIAPAMTTIFELEDEEESTIAILVHRGNP